VSGPPYVWAESRLSETQPADSDPASGGFPIRNICDTRMKAMSATAIVIFAHGSSIESANESVRRIAESVQREGGFDLVEAAFLGGGSPDLDTAVATLVEKGATRVIVVPYFLTLGLHLQRDLPRIISGLARNHPGVTIRTTPPLDGHPALSTILQERARQALEAGRPN